MKIIGVGCGPGLLTEQAIVALNNARLVYGSERAIALARPYLPDDCTIRRISDYRELASLDGDPVILSTGDPLLAGLGYLEGEVIPGISSLQVAAARLHVPLSRIVVVDAHGRGHEQGMHDAVAEVLRKKIVFLLADPKFDVQDLYRQLSALALPVRVAVCEDLAYPGERIAVGEISSPPLPESGLYSLVIGDF